MLTSGTTRALLVHNRNSGTEPIDPAVLLEALARRDIQASYCDHGVDDLGAHLAKDHEFVVVAGGDGTFADVASHIPDRTMPIGVLPLGGSNNIARALAITGTVDEIIARWQPDRMRPLNIGSATDSRGAEAFVEAVGAGAFNHSVKRVDPDPETPEEKRRNGRESFRDVLVGMPAFECSIVTDAWSWSGPTLLVEAMNIRTLGPRLPLAPEADPGDGRLDIVIAMPAERDALVAWLRRPRGRPPVSIRPARSARITIDGQSFRLDDQTRDSQASRETIEVTLESQPVCVLTTSNALHAADSDDD
ncbi:diacylglycerol kinase family lipid kinase [soil metagenome]